MFISCITDLSFQCVTFSLRSPLRNQRYPPRFVDVRRLGEFALASKVGLFYYIDYYSVECSVAPSTPYIRTTCVHSYEILDRLEIYRARKPVVPAVLRATSLHQFYGWLPNTV